MTGPVRLFTGVRVKLYVAGLPLLTVALVFPVVNVKSGSVETKFAFTTVSAESVKVQSLVPVHAPDQPLKAKLNWGVGCSVMVVPETKNVSQLVPHVRGTCVAGSMEDMVPPPLIRIESLLKCPIVNGLLAVLNWRGPSIVRPIKYPRLGTAFAGTVQLTLPDPLALNGTVAIVMVRNGSNGAAGSFTVNCTSLVGTLWLVHEIVTVSPA